MRALLTAAAAVLVVAAHAPAMAHHLSPMDPDIVDYMGMHDAAFESLDPAGSMAREGMNTELDPSNARNETGLPDCQYGEIACGNQPERP